MMSKIVLFDIQNYNKKRFQRPNQQKHKYVNFVTQPRLTIRHFIHIHISQKLPNNQTATTGRFLKKIIHVSVDNRWINQQRPGTVFNSN